AGDRAALEVDAEALLGLTDGEASAARLRAHQLDPVAEPELIRVLAIQIDLVDLLQQVAETALVLDADQLVERRLVRVGVDQHHALPSVARQRAAEVDRDRRLAFVWAAAGDDQLAPALARDLLDRDR